MEGPFEISIGEDLGRILRSRWEGASVRTGVLGREMYKGHAGPWAASGGERDTPLGVFYFSLCLLSADSCLSREKPLFSWISSEPVLRREGSRALQSIGSSVLSIQRWWRWEVRAHGTRVPAKILEAALLRLRSSMRRAGLELPPLCLKEHFGLVNLALVQFCFVLII